MDELQAVIPGNPDEYIVVAALRPLKVGEQFIGWPLHATIVPWFDSEDQSTAIASFKQANTSLGTVEARITADDYFGPRRNVLVHRLDASELYDIHNRLLDEIEKRGGDCPFPHYTRKHYRPHITHKQDCQLQIGDQITFSAVYLVRTNRNESRLRRQKEVMAVVQL